MVIRIIFILILNLVFIHNSSPVLPGTDLLPSGAVWSDIRLKTEVKPLYKYSLSDLMKLEAVSFRYKNSKRTTLGFIAQDVEKIFPEVVHEQGGYKYIFMDQILAVAVKTTQQQQLLINSQREKIADLEAELYSLKEDIQRIKKALAIQ